MLRAGLISLIALFAASCSTFGGGGDIAGPETTVERSARTLQVFAADPDLSYVRANMDKAKALIIAPQIVKAGFIWGGSGGNAVLLVRDEVTGRWGQPAFYTLGSVTFGLQAGAEVSEAVMMVMTTRGVDSLLRSSVKFGGDVSVAAGPVGAGAKAQTADVLAFTRAKGLYGGLNLEGAVVKPRNDRNKIYYDAQITPNDVIGRQNVSNPHANVLIDAVETLERESR
ncbi:MAG: lipid-binding SYLF domain-containing protein [Pseudomonadota bacterium]